MKPPKLHIRIILFVVAGVLMSVQPATNDQPDPIVCIDPGHPSTTSKGNKFQNGLTEVDVNWKMALRLEKLLMSEYGIRTVKTRNVCRRVMANKDRARVANSCGAVFFLRLHCDTGKSSGFTIYYPNRKGEHNGNIGPDVKIINASRKAAYIFHAGMASILRGSLADRGVKGEDRTYIGKKYGALTCSIYSRVPTITVEMLFLSSKHDARFIKSKGGQEKMARALAEGVVRYLRSQRPDVCW